jgi:hypothetical protein
MRETKVRCIDAKEFGIPLVEGETYTVTSKFVGPQDHSEAPIPGMENVSGYTLKEVRGYFRADRFEPVQS